MTQYTPPLPHHAEVKGVISQCLPELDPSLYISVVENIGTELMAPFQNELTNVFDDSIFQSLLNGDTSFNMNYTDQHGRSALHVAVQNHRCDLVKSLLQSGVALESKNSSGFTALHIASCRNNMEIVQWLATNGANVNATSRDGITPLHFAAYNGNHVMVETLLQQKADINVQDHEGRTALMAASQQGHRDTTQTLVKFKADVTKQTKSGKNVLFYTAMKGHKDLVKFFVRENKGLLSVRDNSGSTVFLDCVIKGDFNMVHLLYKLGADIHVGNNDGISALMAAAGKGHESIVHYLIDEGASVSSTDNLGNTILMHAVLHSHYQLTKQLLPYNDLVETVNVRGNTPLIVAATHGDLEMVTLIVESGAQIDVQNHNGISALMAASADGHEDVVQYLLTKGAAITTKTQNGLTALVLAEARKHDTVVKFLNLIPDESQHLSETEVSAAILLAIDEGNIAMVQKFIGQRHNINWADNQGVTLLMKASLKQEIEAVKLLLRGGASVHHENIHGKTAVAYAVQAGSVRVVDWLLSYGATLDKTDAGGYTLLHNAAASGQLEVVKRLEQLGANLNLKDNNGKTALMLAAENGFKQTVLHLVHCGADITAICSAQLNAYQLAIMSEHHDIAIVLSDKNCDDDFEFGDLEKAMFTACKLANSSKVSNLLKQRQKLANCRDPRQDGKLPIHIASERGYDDIVQLLCNKGAKLNERTFSGKTAFFQAAFNGHLQVINVLVKLNANVNIADHDGRTPLMCAAQEGYLEIVNVLIQNGCLINVADKKGNVMALMFALRRHNIHVADTLLKHHANPDMELLEGRTPLFEYCLKGYLPLVTFMVENGANINSFDVDGRTPLMAAAQSGYIEIVKYLVNQGADIRMVSRGNQMAKHFARLRGHYDVEKFLLDCEHGGYDMLISQYPTAVGNQSSNTENTAVEKIIKIDTLQAILEEGESETDAQTTKGLSSRTLTQRLQVAVKEGNISDVKELLEEGAAVNYQDAQGCTLLMSAVRQGHISVIKTLLQHNADLHLLDNKGDDVFSYALENAEMTSSLLSLITERAENPRSGANCSRSIEENHDQTSEKELQEIFLHAVQAGNLQKVKDCLELGDVIHSVDSELRNAVFHCSLSQSQYNVDILNMLTLYQIDINHTDINGTTPLLGSILMGNTPIAVHLIQLGAHVETPNQSEQSPLMECCVTDNATVLDHILQRRQELTDSAVIKSLEFVLINNLHTLLHVFERRLHHLDIFWHCGVLEIHRFGMCNPVVIEKLLQLSKPDTCHHYTQLLLRSILEEDHVGVTNTQLLQLTLASLAGGEPSLKQYQMVVVDPDGHILDIEGNQSKDLSVYESKGDFEDSNCQLVNVAYRKLTDAVLQHYPCCIKGFSMDKSLPKIYVYIAKGTQGAAERFVIQEVMQNSSTHSFNVTFEFVTVTEEASFLATKVWGESIPFKQHTE